MPTVTAISMVNVRDGAEAVFQAVIRSGLHGKNDLLSSESYRTSDLLLLNQQPPSSKAARVYSTTPVSTDLNVVFRPALETLQQAM